MLCLAHSKFGTRRYVRYIHWEQELSFKKKKKACASLGGAGALSPSRPASTDTTSSEGRHTRRAIAALASSHTSAPLYITLIDVTPRAGAQGPRGSATAVREQEIPWCWLWPCGPC